MTEPYSTPEQVDALAEPHPLYQEILDQHKAGTYAASKVDYFDPKALAYVSKIRTEALDKSYGKPPPGVKESSRTIPMRDGHESLILIYEPEQKPAGGSPLIQLNFGGGFVGEARQLGGYARCLVQLFGAVVVNITYRLGPTVHFPVGHYDAWDSFIWLGQHAHELGADPSKGFIVGGVSAGGNLSAVIAQNAVEHNISPPITGLWLCVPKIFARKDQVPSEYRPLYRANSTPNIEDGPILPMKSIKAFAAHYKPDFDSPWYLPTTHGDKSLKGLPKSYIEVDGMDPLRDDGLIYEKIVRKNGTPTRLTVWKGLPHAHFAMMREEKHLSIRREAARDTMRGFAWLLGKAEPSDGEVDKNVVLPSAG